MITNKTLKKNFLIIKEFLPEKLKKKKNDLKEIKIKKSKSLDNNSKINDYDKLIENFYIISCKKEKINKYIQNSEINYEIIFRSKSEKKNPLKKDLIKFIIPFKKKLKIKYTKNNINKINEILFKERKKDFFFIKLNGNNKKKNFNKILKKLNPMENLFYYVFEINDFFINDYNNDSEPDNFNDTLEDDFLFEIENSNYKNYNKKRFHKRCKTFHCLDNLGNDLKKDKKRATKEDFEKNNNSSDLENFDDLEIIYFKKYYVLKTLYPLSSIYLKFFLDYNNLIKNKKLEIFKKSIIDKKVHYKILQKLDSEIFLKFEEIKLQNLLQTFFNFTVQKKVDLIFQKNLSFNIKNYLIDKKRSESEIALKKILKKIPYFDIIFLYLTLILEKTLIIVSTSKYNISFLISILLSFLKPFNWVFPVIYNLPENCLDMLFSPIPIICGINKNSNYVINQIIPNYKVNNKIGFIVYFFDENFFFFDHDVLKFYDVPNYNNFFFDLENLYKSKFCQEISETFKIEKNNNNLKIKLMSLKKNKVKYNKLKKSYTKIEKLNHFDHIINNDYDNFDKCLLNFLNDFYIESIFHHLKKNKFIHKNDLIQVHKILKKFYKTKSDIKFFENFQKTQSFINYLENKLF